jgi:hypothetical protein
VSERPDERFLVVTEHGRVVVYVRGDRSGLDGDLIDVRPARGEDLSDLTMETPLRAFAAKMVDIVQARGSGDLDVSAGLLDMLVKEKAAEDLKRIERTARRLHADGDETP